MTTAGNQKALGKPIRVARVSRHAATSLSKTYAVGLAFTSFGAVYQPASLGFLGASPGVLIIAASLTGMVGLHVTRKEVAEARYLLCWGLLVSALSLLIFGLDFIYITKTAALLILSSIWMSPLFVVPFMVRRHLQNGLAAALVISATGYIFSDLLRGSIPAPLNGLIFGGEYGEYILMRPRAFMQENSHFAAMVGRYLIALFLLFEAVRPYSARRLAWFFGLLTMLLVSLDSKGAAISVLVAVIAIGTTRRLLPVFLLLAPALAWVAMQQVNVVILDIENFTSASTRVTLLLSALSALAHNPLGYGYYGFYGAIQHFGAWSMDWLGERVPLVLTEVVDIVEELNNVSTKSTLLDFSIIFGIPFIAFLWRFFIRCNLTDPRVKAAVVYALLSAMSTSGHESISFFLILAILVRWYSKGKATTRRWRFRPPQHAAQAPTVNGPSV